MANLKGTTVVNRITPGPGTTAQRPATFAGGQLRYNTTLSEIEVHQGNLWDGPNIGARVTSFTAAGPATFNVPVGVTSVHVLVVAGGGSGGGAGGGGAGGMVEHYAFPVTPGGTVAVNVGNGGSPITSPTSFQQGNDGQNTTFGTITALGGGGGGAWNPGASANNDGRAGGSGGGAGTSVPSAGSVGPGQQAPSGGGTGYGFPGGNALTNAPWCAGGGGGASSPGGQAHRFPAIHDAAAGQGGSGRISSVTGSAIYWAGGGGGGCQNPSGRGGDGGRGGGGGGGINSGTGGAGGTGINNGQAGGVNGPLGLGGAPYGYGGTAGTNTGGGGGGMAISVGRGGGGGPGIVVVRY